MERTHVDFEYSKDFGVHKKGDKQKLYRPLARQLQEERKVGKIQGDEEHAKVVKENITKAKKAVKPPSNKADKKVSSRATK